ncbi:MAG: hypothetical protein ACE5FL_07565 [Myxococcota bacterium]
MDRIPATSAAVLVGLLLGATPAASITGVCPDGSIYIVPRSELIPCRDSKQVRSEDVPPIRPRQLPRPFGWETFHRRNDPNNPYNIVDSIRAQRGEPPAPGPADDPTARIEEPGLRRQASIASAPPPVGSGPPPRPLDLKLAPEEVRDLQLIVEYSQRRAPASFARGSDDRAPSLVLRIAQSRSFEARRREALASVGQPVRGASVLFTAVASTDEAFYANLTFVQGHMAFHPDPASSSELGVIDGRLGILRPDDRVLGYVVLPERMDLGQPIDIYWNDRQITATLQP